MADRGPAGVDELDPMEKIEQDVDEALGSAPPQPPMTYLDSEGHEPPPVRGDTY